MKRVAAAALFAMVLLPGVASAGASTDAALGLGAFAVFNQILGGVGIFGRPAVVAQPVVVAPPPPVYVPPPPVYYAPQPVYIAPPPPVAVYEAPAPVYYYPRHARYEPRGFCPPGWAKHGRCDNHWHR